MNFEEVKEYLNKEECVASEYDDKSFTVLEFGTFENKLDLLGLKEEDLSSEQRQTVANNLQKKFKFANVGLAEEDYCVDFDFTLLKEDCNCNLQYILNAIHSFHDSMLEEVKRLVK